MQEPDQVYYGKDSVISYGSFTVMRPTGMNFSFIFYKLPDIFDSLKLFFEKTFNKEAGLPLNDAKKVAAAVAEKVKNSMSWDFTTG